MMTAFPARDLPTAVLLAGRPQHMLDGFDPELLVEP